MTLIYTLALKEDPRFGTKIFYDKGLTTDTEKSMQW
jgi:hypothetical protein